MTSSCPLSLHPSPFNLLVLGPISNFFYIFQWLLGTLFYKCCHINTCICSILFFLRISLLDTSFCSCRDWPISGLLEVRWCHSSQERGGLRRREWSTVRANENPCKQRPDVSVQLVGLRGGHSLGSTSAEAEPIVVKACHSTATPVPTPSGLSVNPWACWVRETSRHWFLCFKGEKTEAQKCWKPWSVTEPGLVALNPVLQEKMLNITHYQRDTDQNHNEVPSHASQDGCHRKVYKQ